jgi:hypothetical protein
MFKAHNILYKIAALNASNVAIHGGGITYNFNSYRLSRVSDGFVESLYEALQKLDDKGIEISRLYIIGTADNSWTDFQRDIDNNETSYKNNLVGIRENWKRSYQRSRTIIQYLIELSGGVSGSGLFSGSNAEKLTGLWLSHYTIADINNIIWDKDWSGRSYNKPTNIERKQDRTTIIIPIIGNNEPIKVKDNLDTENNKLRCTQINKSFSSTDPSLPQVRDRVLYLIVRKISDTFYLTILEIPRVANKAHSSTHFYKRTDSLLPSDLDQFITYSVKCSIEDDSTKLEFDASDPYQKMNGSEPNSILSTILGKYQLNSRMSEIKGYIKDAINVGSSTPTFIMGEYDAHSKNTNTRYVEAIPYTTDSYGDSSQIEILKNGILQQELVEGFKTFIGSWFTNDQHRIGRSYDRFYETLLGKTEATGLSSDVTWDDKLWGPDGELSNLGNSIAAMNIPKTFNVDGSVASYYDATNYMELLTP